MIQLSLRDYFTNVILPCILVTVSSLSLSIVCKYLMPEGIVYTIIECILSALLVAVFSYSLGLTKGERSFINEKISIVYKKIIQV